MLSDRFLSVCLSVCLSVTLVPNGWMDQDETWHGGTPRPWPHLLHGEAAPRPPKGHSRQFTTHTACGQTAQGIKMPLGMEVGLDPGDIVFYGGPSSP